MEEGFEIKCKKCGSTRVSFSIRPIMAPFGGYGDEYLEGHYVDFDCEDCRNKYTKKVV